LNGYFFIFGMTRIWRCGETISAENPASRSQSFVTFGAVVALETLPSEALHVLQ
jgi:hypothetical protein